MTTYEHRQLGEHDWKRAGFGQVLTRIAEIIPHRYRMDILSAIAGGRVILVGAEEFRAGEAGEG